MSIEQPEAWIVINKETGYRIQVSYFPDLYNKDMFELIPLYTAPPKREPLSEQQIREGNPSMLNATREIFIKGVQFAEAMHGIGEEK